MPAASPHSIAELFLDLTAGRNAPPEREEGRDWPDDADTMIGFQRLRNVVELCQDCIRRDVPGDFMECCVWRGGTVIMMAALIREAGQENARAVWVADSFQGCPPPSHAYPADKGDHHHTMPFLAVPAAEVKARFEKYGLSGPNVRFLEGWFKDTLPGPVERLAVLRVDGDLYESTWQVLNALYACVAPSGWIIVDDYGAVHSCRRAVDDFREAWNITAPLQEIDWTGVFWQKEP